MHTSPLQIASTRSVVRIQRLRFILGMLQMFGVVFSLVLIFKTGINELSLAATVMTCAATSVSVLLFGRRK